MPRYRLIIEFDGAPFVGWQRQENGLSVQEAIETATLAFSGETTTAFAAGRTDAGVHALAMPVHFDLVRAFDDRTMRDAMNAHLRPAPIAVLAARRVDDAFHVRHSAVQRRYLYRIANRRAPPALDRGRVWHVAGALDIEAMAAAAADLLGKHDFTTFRAAQCQAASPVKTLSHLSVARENTEVLVRAAAPSFLHHQVRSIVGSLVQVGLGRWPASQLGAALRACDRAQCGPVAPADGLYFDGADYENSL